MIYIKKRIIEHKIDEIRNEVRLKILDRTEGLFFWDVKDIAQDMEIFMEIYHNIKDRIHTQIVCQ